MSHDYRDLIRLFNRTFEQSHNTHLVKGDDEPVYLPADETHLRHRIIFAHGYYASAMHELAHWFIAGEKRRELEDYGYWYNPDGRDAAQQAEFEKVEIKPQAVEWGLCVAAGFKFNVSTDNLNGAEPDRESFKRNVKAQVDIYLEKGFPTRAAQFMRVLAAHYEQPYPITAGQFEEPHV